MSLLREKKVLNWTKIRVLAYEQRIYGELKIAKLDSANEYGVHLLSIENTRKEG